MQFSSVRGQCSINEKLSVRNASNIVKVRGSRYSDPHMFFF